MAAFVHIVGLNWMPTTDQNCVVEGNFYTVSILYKKYSYGIPSDLGKILNEEVPDKEELAVNLGTNKLRGYCESCKQPILKLHPFLISQSPEHHTTIHHPECFIKWHVLINLLEIL